MIYDYVLNAKHSQSSIMKQICMITLIICLGTATLYGNQIPMLNTSQFHFIPQGSYLQLSINSAEIGENSFSALTFSQILGGLSFIFTRPQPPLYNLLYFPSSSPNSEFLYQCYTRAASGGLSQVSCVFDEVYPNSMIQCQQCLQQAFSSNKTVACLNCSANVQLDISKLTQKEEHFLSNGTVLLIIDNSPVIFNTGQKQQIELYLGYSIYLRINEDLSSLVYLISVIIGILVIILSIIAAYVTFMIKKYDKDIVDQQKKNQ